MKQPVCYYCERDKKDTPATQVCHDKRGCLFCCDAHAEWRKTTSTGFGHGQCPCGYPDGSSPGLNFVHVVNCARCKRSACTKPGLSSQARLQDAKKERDRLGKAVKCGCPKHGKNLVHHCNGCLQACADFFSHSMLDNAIWQIEQQQAVVDALKDPSLVEEFEDLRTSKKRGMR